MKGKVITTLTLLCVVTIITGACTPKIQLPILYEAPDFTLTNQDNLEIELSDFRDKVVVLDFIYTRCPDVCGEMSFRLQGVWHQLDEALRQDIVLVSVSFDLHDTPVVLKKYANIWDVPGWQFLSGTEGQISQVKNDYGVIAFSSEPDGWELTHNIVIVLIDRDGMVRKTYADLEYPQKDMVKEFEHILKQ